MSTPILTQFESAVLAWIAARSDDRCLQEQLRRAVLVERHHTGAGCYSTIAVPRETPESKAAYSTRGPLPGPYFDSAAIALGGGTLLWFEAGRARCLEIFAIGDRFPEDHAALGDFTLSSGS